MPVWHRDYETRAVVDLKQAGMYVYFDDEHTDVWCCQHAVDGGEVTLWVPGDPVPHEAVACATEPGWLAVAHNAPFEMQCERKIMSTRYGWPEIPLHRQRCTMAMALAMGLPASLDDVAGALGLAAQKDRAGYRLMLQMARPRRKTDDMLGAYVWWDAPEKRERLYDYCRQDVEVERQVYHALVPLSDAELEVWRLDRVINDRGVYIDRDLADGALKIVEDTTAALNSEMAEVTDGHVMSVSATAQLRAWLETRGVDAQSVAKADLLELLARRNLAPDVRRALELRRDGGKTSTAKISAMLARRQSDGRVRGNLQYHGASTGRWAARGVQLQNLPRPSTEEDLSGVIKALRTGDARLIEALFGPPLQVVADCVRGLIASPTSLPDAIMAADFASIEACVNPWLAGEQRKLDEFVAARAGEGPEPYKIAASAVFNVDPADVSKAQRQVGKVAELALGFGGGAAALLKMAKGLGVDLAGAADAVRRAAGPDANGKATQAWVERGVASGAEQVDWITAELIKMAWRRRNPRIVQLWRDLEDTALAAVRSPGEIKCASNGRVRYRMSGSFLGCELPSKRVIYYPVARIVEKDLPWDDLDGAPARGEAIEYRVVDSVTNAWRWNDFYGGLACENVVQAVARDIMVHAMLRVEAAGYPVILTVHDEVVTEPPAGASFDQFLAIMNVPPPWATGCPIAVEGWAGERYRK